VTSCGRFELANAEFWLLQPLFEHLLQPSEWRQQPERGWGRRRVEGHRASRVAWHVTKTTRWGEHCLLLRDERYSDAWTTWACLRRQRAPRLRCWRWLTGWTNFREWYWNWMRERDRQKGHQRLHLCRHGRGLRWQQKILRYYLETSEIWRPRRVLCSLTPSKTFRRIRTYVSVRRNKIREPGVATARHCQPGTYTADILHVCEYIPIQQICVFERSA
jgi:hypothetical protein